MLLHKPDFTLKPSRWSRPRYLKVRTLLGYERFYGGDHRAPIYLAIALFMVWLEVWLQYLNKCTRAGSR